MTLRRARRRGMLPDEAGPPPRPGQRARGRAHAASAARPRSPVPSRGGPGRRGGARLPARSGRLPPPSGRCPAPSRAARVPDAAGGRRRGPARPPGESRAPRVPVVMLLPASDAREVAQCYQVGANSCVRKPVEFARFSDAIQARWPLLARAQPAPPRAATPSGSRSVVTLPAPPPVCASEPVHVPHRLAPAPCFEASVLARAIRARTRRCPPPPSRLAAQSPDRHPLPALRAAQRPHAASSTRTTRRRSSR